jgi:hypothetical protein
MNLEREIENQLTEYAHIATDMLTTDEDETARALDESIAVELRLTGLKKMHVDVSEQVSEVKKMKDGE